MSDNQSLIQLLRCPACCGGLRPDSTQLVCVDCGEAFPIVRGTPRLLVRNLRDQLSGAHGADAPDPCDSVTAAKLKTAASFGYEWQRFHQLRDEWERNFFEYMQPHGSDYFAGKRVLDAGCGTGRHAYYAAKFGADVLAVDLSDAIDVAHANTTKSGRVTTVQADLYNLPIEPESFDLIYSIGVLHHLPDPEGAFQNLLRYLKPGGEIRIYLYWWPEGRPVKRSLLAAVSALRKVTTRMPHGMLYWLSYPLAAAAFAGFVIPYRVLRRFPAARGIAEQLPMKQYSAYPFQVCVNDQFDRFSAPIENRYKRAEVAGWLERGSLESCSVVSNWGWVASGRKPLSSKSGPIAAEPLKCAAGD